MKTNMTTEKLLRVVSTWKVFLICLTIMGSCLNAARADDNQGAAHDRNTTLSDLTLFNLFSEGWDQPWAKRERAAPDMALLRVTTNFLEREFRLDYARTNDIRNNPKLDSTDFLNGLIAYGLNRRLMIEAITNYQWNNARAGTDEDGAGGGGLVRLQLIDTSTSSYAAQVKVATPNKGIGQTQTSVSYALAGFNDLQSLLNLNQVGLYYSFQYESLSGPHKPGTREDDISYDLSLAKTWTDPNTPIFGNFTTFAEAFATTNLNGDKEGQTVFTITPGLRFWFARENSLILGVDLPVNDPHPFGNIVRATYILNFQ